jgi:hypothetical protein
MGGCHVWYAACNIPWTFENCALVQCNPLLKG